jgi:hypothetical protein
MAKSAAKSNSLVEKLKTLISVKIPMLNTQKLSLPKSSILCQSPPIEHLKIGMQ